jgi:predicted O-methyltransferase YrrM
VLQVDIWLGDACIKLSEVSSATGRPIDLLLLDGLPKETMQYLKAAEPHLAPGAMVVADNAGAPFPHKHSVSCRGLFSGTVEQRL